MNWTQDQIVAVIGTKELEIISLRMRVAELNAKVKELTPPEAENKLEAVK